MVELGVQRGDTRQEHPETTIMDLRVNPPRESEIKLVPTFFLFIYFFYFFLYHKATLFLFPKKKKLTFVKNV